MNNNENNVMKKLVEVLIDPGTSKLDIARYLIQNGVEISDEDFDSIVEAIPDEEEDKSSIKVEMSDDGKAFAVFDLDDTLPKEVKKTFVNVPTREEARFLQDFYYQTQKRRIAIQGQMRSLAQSTDSKSDDEKNNEKNNSFLVWYLNKLVAMENNIKSALEAFSNSYYISRWAKANIGIGPVIATSLAANINIEKEMHAGNLWSYCGLNDNKRPWLGKKKAEDIVNDCILDNGGILDDNTVNAIALKSQWKYSYLENKAKTKKGWSKAELIKACSFLPYNKSMKVLMYKIGHSFRLCQKRPNSLYARILKEREAYEMQKNLNGDYKDQAERILKTKNIGKNTVAYSYYIKGQLPPAHIRQRSERYTTKMFMSHLFEAGYYNKFGENCPEPYIIGFSAHNDYIEPEVPYDSIPRDSSD